MNSKLDRSDPRLMLAIFAIGVALAVTKSLSNIRVEPSLETIEPWAPVAMGAVALAAALATHRFLATRRTLRSRHSVAVVPADQFDAKPEVVLSFAAQLASSERSVAGWTDRRASALRVRLLSDGERRLVYVLEVPERSAQLLRSALLGYEGVELRSAEEALGEPQPVEAPRTLRTELVLALPSVEPLARYDGDPDPLQPFAAALASLRPERGEEASVCLDLLPATGRRRVRLRRRLRREARRRKVEHSDWSELLGGGGRAGGKRDRVGPDELTERRLLGRALDAKLKVSGPLFEAQVLLRCRAPEKARAKAAMARLLAAFEPLSERNWLRASGLPIPGLAFLGSDLPLRRGRFDHRFETGFFRPARRSILTARELAGFLKPPTVNCRAENVLRSGALLGVPPELPTFDATRKDLIPLGRISDESGERIVGVRVADTFFSYTSGRSRYGKTESAIVQFVHLARSGHGALFLDPHGDALDRMEPYLTEPEVARRVIRIDLRPERSLDHLPGWNLFELSGAGPVEAEARVDAIVDAFASALEWGERSTRAINLTTQAASALAAIAQQLPDELAPTVFQIPTLLSDATWRGAALPFLPQASRAFWTDRFPLLASDAITPLTNMVDRLRASTSIAVLLGQSRSSYRIREAMDKRQIVLVCTGTGGPRDRVVSNLLVFDLFHGARGRADLAAGERALFWPFFDEVQSYDGGASDTLAALTEQLAKFGVRAAFLSQNPERLNPATLTALLTNRSHMLSSALNARAASLLAREWPAGVGEAALMNLERFHFIAQVTDRGRSSSPFALRGIRLEDVFDLDEFPAVQEPEERAGEMTAAETLQHLETLDQRIKAALLKGACGRASRKGESGPRSGPVSFKRAGHK